MPFGWNPTLLTTFGGQRNSWSAVVVAFWSNFQKNQLPTKTIRQFSRNQPNGYSMVEAFSVNSSQLADTAAPSHQQWREINKLVAKNQSFCLQTSADEIDKRRVGFERTRRDNLVDLRRSNKHRSNSQTSQLASQSASHTLAIFQTPSGKSVYHVDNCLETHVMIEAID